MLKNYLKTILRNLIRNKTYSVINILGFSIGLTISVLLIFYVKHELSFDDFHKNKDYIFRLGIKQNDGKKTTQKDYTLTVMGPEITEEFPEIKDFVRLSTYRGGSLIWKNKGFQENKIRYADSSFFEIFSFHLVKGNPNTALSGTNKIVITKELADKIFGDKDPVGEPLTYNGTNNLTVSGVIQNPPARSHIKFNALISFETIYKNYSKGQFGWNGGWGYYTYFLLNQKKPAKELNTKLDTLFYNKIGKNVKEYGWTIEPLLHPLEDIYLHYGGMYRQSSSGNLNNIYIFGAIAVFVLLIASINFMNLSTAQSIKRVKEVGIRKVAGASRKNLIFQFLGESLIITFIAFALAFILIEVFMPQFNQLLGKELSIYAPHNRLILAGLPLLVLIVGIVAGSYPAFFISGYKTSNILKGSSSSGKQKHSLRNGLIIIQFIISVILIISSIIIYSQLHYAQNKKLGYSRDNVLSISLESENVIKKDKVFKEQILQLPNVKSASIASAYPGLGLPRYGFIPQGSEESKLFHVLDVDEDFLKTMQLELKKGRGFQKDHPTDKITCLINETLAKRLNWDEPIGKIMERNGEKKVIGVVKDFHFASLHKEIEPLVFRLKQPWKREQLLVKFNNDQTRTSLKNVHKTWRNLFGNEPISYEFVDNTFQKAYKIDLQFSQIILFFTILAILIACMGLFGLTAFSTEQRTKEIGIRKALGASVYKINNLIMKQFLRWVIIANLIAWPAAYYLMKNWIQDYAYKIDIHIGYFIGGAATSIVIAIITVSYLSIRAARNNPVDSLRDE
jgi:putative ABC transport system permease protein